MSQTKTTIPPFVEILIEGNAFSSSMVSAFRIIDILVNCEERYPDGMNLKEIREVLREKYPYDVKNGKYTIAGINHSTTTNYCSKEGIAILLRNNILKTEPATDIGPRVRFNSKSLEPYRLYLNKDIEIFISS